MQPVDARRLPVLGNMARCGVCDALHDGGARREGAGALLVLPDSELVFRSGVAALHGLRDERLTPVGERVEPAARPVLGRAHDRVVDVVLAIRLEAAQHQVGDGAQSLWRHVGR